MRKLILWLVIMSLITMIVPGGISRVVAEEAVEMLDNWYEEMCGKAMIRAGNNKRLMNVIERARKGENLTIAVIGGSITEGAGATTYAECWARKVLDGFRTRYGVGDGTHIGLVNAGVGGTASTFGWMRWERDVLNKVKDEDGLPDLVIVEYAVNDGQEPTRHQCYESMVRSILEQPNHPAVILLFSVFVGGYSLQQELIPIGEKYDLMMVSMRNSAYPYVGKKWTEKEYYADQYHPTSLGHGVMADCILKTIETAAAMPEAEQDIETEVEPAYGVRFMGMKRIFRDSLDPELELNPGSFDMDDQSSYNNLPVGRVCGSNFHHDGNHGNEPLTFKATFKQMLVACRTTLDEHYGKTEIVVDGDVVYTIDPHLQGSWGQSDVFWVFHKADSAEHFVEIRMAEGEENKRCTITAISYVP